MVNCFPRLCDHICGFVKIVKSLLSIVGRLERRLSKAFRLCGVWRIAKIGPCFGTFRVSFPLHPQLSPSLSPPPNRHNYNVVNHFTSFTTHDPHDFEPPESQTGAAVPLSYLLPLSLLLGPRITQRSFYRDANLQLGYPELLFWSAW